MCLKNLLQDLKDNQRELASQLENCKYELSLVKTVLKQKESQIEKMSKELNGTSWVFVEILLLDFLK